MTKTELLQNLRDRHDRLLTIVKVLQDKGLDNEIINKKWVVKDVVSHVIFYENEMVKVLKNKTLENNTFYTRSDDDRNDENFNATHNLSLEEIIFRANRVYNEMYSVIELMSDEELNTKFPGMKSEVAKFIEYQSFAHYDEHIPILEKRFNV